MLVMCISIILWLFNLALRFLQSLLPLLASLLVQQTLLTIYNKNKNNLSKSLD